MSRKQHEILFALRAAVDSNFTGSFHTAGKSIQSLSNELKAMNAGMRKIDGYQATQAQIKKTENRLTTLNKEYGKIESQIKETGDESGELAEKLQQKQIRIREVENTLNGYNEKLEQSKKALQEAGINTENLSEETERLKASYEKMTGIQQQLGNITAAQEQNREAITKTIHQVGTLTGALTAASVAAYQFAVKPSIAFESAFAGVKKTVDATDAELENIRQSFLRMSSSEIPATAEEIAAVGEAAGQLGIATENIAAFSRTMIDLGEATNMTATEAASDLAKFANVTKMPQEEFDRLGSVVVALGNNYATTERDIVSMATRLASAGELTGLSQSQIMAVSTALSSVGIEAEAGGSAFSKLMKTVNVAVETYDQATNVIDQTGYSLRDLQMMASHDGKSFGAIAKSLSMTKAELQGFMKNAKSLEQFSDVAGVSAEQFIQAYGDDSVKALSLFIEGLNDTERNGKGMVEILNDMGLTEIRLSNAIQSLATAEGMLSGAVDMANTAWNENAALSKEAAQRYETTESKIQIAKNAVTELGITLGDMATPALRDMAEGVTDTVRSLSLFVKENPEAVEQALNTAKNVGLAAAGFLGFKLAAQGTTGVVLKVGKEIKKLQALGGAKGFKGLTAGIVKTTSSLKFAAGAAGVAVAAVGALTAAMVLQQEEAKKLAAETSGALLFNNGAEKLSDITARLQESTSETLNFSRAIQENSGELEEVKSSLSDAQSSIFLYGATLRKDGILTAEEAEQLKDPFNQLADCLENDFTIRYGVVFDAFKASASEVADSLGVDVGKISGILDGFRNKYIGNISDAEERINTYHEKVASGGTVSDEETEQYRKDSAYLNDLAASESESFQAIQKEIAKLETFDFGENKLEAQETLQSLYSYAETFLGELDGSFTTIVDSIEDLRGKAEIGLQHEQITPYEYKTTIEALDAAEKMQEEAYQAKRKEFTDTLSQVSDKSIAGITAAEEQFAYDFTKNTDLFSTSIDRFLAGVEAWSENIGGTANGIQLYEQKFYQRGLDKGKEEYSGLSSSAEKISSLTQSEALQASDRAGISERFVKNSEPVDEMRLSGLEHNANGTNYSADTFVAGELGPEIITNAKGSKVFTHIETGRIFDNLAYLEQTYAKEAPMLDAGVVSNTTHIHLSPTAPGVTVNGAGGEQVAQIAQSVLDDFFRHRFKDELEEKLGDLEHDQQRRLFM